VFKKVKIFSGRRHPKLTRRICDYLGEPMGKVNTEKPSYHSDGDDFPLIDESVRGCHCIYVEPTVKPAALSWMHTLLMCDALRRAHAREITVIIPNFGYARAERKEMDRTSISAALISTLLETTGANRIVLLDPHADAIQGFFRDMSVEKLTALPLFASVLLRETLGRRVVLGGPDLNAAKTHALPMRTALPGATISAIAKIRCGDEEVEVMEVLGDVQNADVEGFDDLVTTGGTLGTSAKAWIARGALIVRANVTHPMLVAGYAEKLKNPNLSRIRVTNSTPLPATFPEELKEKLEVIDIAPLIGEAIKIILEDSPTNPMHRLFEPQTWQDGKGENLVLPQDQWDYEELEETQIAELVVQLAGKKRAVMELLTKP